jgi:hypothetical protein
MVRFTVQQKVVLNRTEPDRGKPNCSTVLPSKRMVASAAAERSEQPKHQQKRFLVIAASQGLLYLIVYVTPVSISDSLSSNL